MKKEEKRTEEMQEKTNKTFIFDVIKNTIEDVNLNTLVYKFTNCSKFYTVATNECVGCTNNKRCSSCFIENFIEEHNITKIDKLTFLEIAEDEKIILKEQVNDIIKNIIL